MIKKNIPVLFFISLFFISSAGNTQIGNILKAGEKMLDKSPTKLMEKYFSNAPITTSFDDAKTELMLLSNFDPPENYFSSLWDLDQNENGDYIVTEGLYTGINKSFCLKAGTYGPSGGDGHLYANLEGPKAYLIKKLLENWLTKSSDIPQRDVQSLIWAIIARTDVDKMQPRYKLTLARLIDKEDMVKLAANSLKDKALEAGMEKFKAEIPSEIYKVFQAERELRNLFNKVDASYDQFEQMAVLAGIAPAADMIRPVSKARWSFHPNGYFIRLTPNGYSRTRVDVYIPMPVEAEIDAKGMISSLTYNGSKMVEFVYENTVTQNEMEFRSSVAGINVIQDRMMNKTTVKIQHGFTPGFIKNDFLIDKNSGSTGTKIRRFADLLFAETGSLDLKLDQLTKNKLYNISSCIQNLEALPSQVMQTDLNNFIRFLLNEAYNYSVYKNLSIKDGKAFNNPSVKPNDELLVITNLPTENSGPQLNFYEEGNNFPDKQLNSVFNYKQDRGDLDLPGTVATPANRSSQRIGQSKPPKDKPWYEKLPPCPCTYKAAQDSAKKNGSGWKDCGAANQDYHFGAVNEVRWIPPESGMSGQQCTYDAEGNLITSGIAAGSPDKVSPQSCGSVSFSAAVSFPGHYVKDMRTFSNLPCWQYLRDWPANNANKCAPSNPVSDIKNMKNMVGDMTCPEITELMKEAAKSKTISDKLKDYILGNGAGDLSEAELLDELNKWKESEGCPGKSICTLINKAGKNLVHQD